MNKKETRPGHILRSILASHSLLPVSAVLLFLVLASALYFVYTETQRMRVTLNNDFNQQQLILARKAAAEIGRGLDDIVTEMKRLERLLVSATNLDDMRDHMQSSLDLTRSKGMVELGLVDRSGEFVDCVSIYGIPPVDSTKLSIIRELKGSRRMELGPLQVRSMENDESFIAAYLSTRINHPILGQKTLYARVDVTRLVRAFAQGIRSGATGSAWVIDENGVFLYHPEQEFIGRNAFTARRERQPYISFNEINRIMQERMLQGEEGTGNYISGWHRGTSGEMEKLLAFSSVRTPTLAPGRLWSVAVSAPVSEINRTLDKVRNRHLLIEVAVILAMLGFAFLVAAYQRRMSRALKEKVTRQEEYITAILQNSVDAIAFIDNNNQIKVWNKGAEEIFGYTAEEMIGGRFRRLVPPEFEADRELKRIVDEVYEKGYIKNYQTQRLTKSGRRITVNISRSLIRNEEGEPIGSAAIMQDITEKVEMDKHIYNTEKLASIGVLAAGVAHEINNPLAIILGFTDLLKERFDEGAPELEDLGMIEKNANDAKKIVENLLGFARVSEGSEEIVDIGEALDTVVAITRNTLMTKKVEVATDIEPNLPHVVGDSREFQQVIFNLINNATAAMGDEGGMLTLTAVSEGGWVKVRVHDTGQGIPNRIKAQIFDPFFTTKKVGKGTGLGLSLCYGIVQKYGGKLEFASVSKEDEPDMTSGTTFTVSMPVSKAEETVKESQE